MNGRADTAVEALANRLCEVMTRLDRARAEKWAKAFCEAATEDVGQFKYTFIQHAAHAVKFGRVDEIAALKSKALGQIVEFASGGRIESTAPYKD